MILMKLFSWKNVRVLQTFAVCAALLMLPACADAPLEELMDPEELDATTEGDSEVADDEDGLYRKGAYMSIVWPFGPNESPVDWQGEEGTRTPGASCSCCGGTRSSTHAGADYNARDLNISGPGDYGKSVYAGFYGQIILASDKGDGYGKTVVIYDKSRHVAVRYSHLAWEESGKNQGIVVSVGQWVNARQLIGRVGNTGESTGPHLHLAGYENINDNYGNPIIPDLCDSDYYTLILYFIS